MKTLSHAGKTRSYWGLLTSIALSLLLVCGQAAESETNVESPANETNAEGGRVKTARSIEPINRRPPVDLIRVFADGTVTANDTVNDFVTVFGNGNVAGEVRQNMIVVGGNAVLDGTVNHDMVVVLGSVKLTPTARVNGTLTVVGGRVDQFEESQVRRGVVLIGLPSWMPQFDTSMSWLRDGLLLMRPLPPSSTLAWKVAGLFFLIYILVSLLFPKPVGACAGALENRMLASFLCGFGAMILLSIVCLVLLLTGIGILLIPIVKLAALAVLFVGKAGVFQFLGGQLVRGFNSESKPAGFPSLIIGASLVTITYMVPILGFVAYGAFACMALGAACVAAVGLNKPKTPAQYLVNPPPLFSSSNPQPPPATMPGNVSNPKPTPPMAVPMEATKPTAPAPIISSTPPASPAA